MKKITLFLAFLCFAVAANAITLYYKNTNNWSTVNAYAWNGGGETLVLGAWPGSPMTAVSGQDGWFSIDCTTTPGKIIFNNGNGGEGNQTGDLTIDASNPYYNNGWTNSFDGEGNNGGNEGGDEGDDNPGDGGEASYGILINGTTYYAGTLNPAPMDPSFEEYQVLGVPVKANDQLKLYNRTIGDAWTVTLDAASTAEITLSGESYVCSADGCYDFYIKLKYEADQLYIGATSGDCSGNQGETITPGEGGNEGEGGDNPDGGEILPSDFYLMGYINGEDYNGYDYKFNADNTLSIQFTETSYVYLLTGDGREYMATAYIEPAEAAVGTFATTGPNSNQKMGVPGGVDVHFTLADNGDDTYTLSYTTGATALESIYATTIYADNGRIYGAEGARIYTVSGLDVTDMNGQLNGIYIVRAQNATYKVAVK